ncbi:hypothetical protein TSAR_008098, partial [Trichomalopsis sarcophagae]
KYINSSSKTRNKNIQLPKISKTIATKNSYYVAIKIFNNLSNELKELCGSKQNLDLSILPVLRKTLLQPLGNVATHQNVRFFIARLIISHTVHNILETLPEDCIPSFRNIARYIATRLYNI